MLFKSHAKRGEDIYGDVNGNLQDGFGFLLLRRRLLLAGPDDIYVSPAKFAALIYALAKFISGKYVRQGRRTLFCLAQSGSYQL